TRVMLHQPLGGVQGQASDIEITANQVLKIKKELYDIIAKHSGQSYQRVHDVSDRDHGMVAAEAKEFGIIDDVLT
ncbi:MAG TPA: ATP-dependent Clp protease proteolytic subunit, partial [Sphingobacterium sp.]|nr:ATP-dependent Clp protease proteolytic subunit [Sphingobacterium sp.]